jgi:hypothetical protein
MADGEIHQGNTLFLGQWRRLNSENLGDPMKDWYFLQKSTHSLTLEANNETGSIQSQTTG